MKKIILLAIMLAAICGSFNMAHSAGMGAALAYIQVGLEALPLVIEHGPDVVDTGIEYGIKALKWTKANGPVVAEKATKYGKHGVV